MSLLIIYLYFSNCHFELLVQSYKLYFEICVFARKNKLLLRLILLLGIFLSTYRDSHRYTFRITCYFCNRIRNIQQPYIKAKLMKRNEWMALIVTSFMMMAVCLSAQAKVKKTVERGMTKQEVIAIMGQPKLTSFDAYGDKWEYYKMNVILGESKRIVVGFDLNGRVVAYETKFWDNNTNSEIGNCNQRPAPPYGAGAGPDGPAYYACCLDDASFSRLYNKVKGASFDDNKLDLIEVASLGCFYSCSQTARMMKIFTFGDKQLKVLRLMAPHIVDLQNATDIYNVFTFDSEKSKAGEIMRNSRP